MTMRHKGTLKFKDRLITGFISLLIVACGLFVAFVLGANDTNMFYTGIAIICVVPFLLGFSIKGGS